MNKFNYYLDKLNLTLINLLTFIIGIIILFASLIIPNNPENSLTVDIKTILISISCSMIASSIVAFLSAKYLLKQNQTKDIIDIWGLESIYETRTIMNESSNRYLNSMENNMDIIALGMRNFRDAQGSLIEKKVKKGVKIRILTLNPNSPFVSQREIEERDAEGAIKKTIEDLIEWVNVLKEIAPNESNIEIKFYDTCPLDSYLRIDDHIYTGPNLYGLLSQQTISYEFKNNSKGYMYYNNYFNKLWNNNNFSSINIF